MNYNCIEFAVLCAIHKKATSQSEIIASAFAQFYSVPSFELCDLCLQHLIDGDFAEYKCGCIYPTEKCKKLFSKKSLFESKESRISKAEDEFMSLELSKSSGENYLSRNEYEKAKAMIEESLTYMAPVCFDAEGGSIIFNSSQGMCDEDDSDIAHTEDVFSLSYAENPELPSLLLEISDAMLSPSKCRKVCVKRDGANHVLSFSYEENSIKISLCRILYNSKLFWGKRDSRLDYAQTGDEILKYHTDKNKLYMSAVLLYTECLCRGEIS